MTRIGTSTRIAAILAAFLVTGLAGTSRAQVALPSDPVPWWVGQVFVTPGGSPLARTFLEATAPEAVGGQKFELHPDMHDTVDPQNGANEVIAVDTLGGTIGVAVRNFPGGIYVTALENQINLKYFFPARTCDGGSPRIQLAFDLNGDGLFDANALGYVGHGQFGLGCVTGEWDAVDMTDQVARWDLSWMSGGMSMTWDQVETFVTTFFPAHRVLSGSLVDDSAGFAPGAAGQAYYDLFTMGDLTLEKGEDTVPQR